MVASGMRYSPTFVSDAPSFVPDGAGS